MFNSKLKHENKVLKATINNLNAVIKQYEENYNALVEENKRLIDANNQPLTFGGK